MVSARRTKKQKYKFIFLKKTFYRFMMLARAGRRKKIQIHKNIEKVTSKFLYYLKTN